MALQTHSARTTGNKVFITLHVILRLPVTKNIARKVKGTSRKSLTTEY